jgi:acyl-CoA synthetase (AMP-forming)/AMP-acid ligase II
MVGVNQGFLKPSNKLLAAEVDSLAKSDPGRRFGLIPKSNQIEDGFREITFLDLSRAVNATSWWVEKHIGRPNKGETIAYMGNNDVRYILFMLASHKLGYTVCSYLVSVCSLETYQEYRSSFHPLDCQMKPTLMYSARQTPPSCCSVMRRSTEYWNSKSTWPSIL